MNIRIAAVAAIALATLTTSAEARRSHHYRHQQPTYDYSAHTSYRTDIYASYGPVSGEFTGMGGITTNKQISRKHVKSRHRNSFRNSGLDRGIRRATSSRAYKRLTRKLAEQTDSIGATKYAKVHTSTGLTATVIASAKDKFQGFIDAVEAAGYKIGDMGCKSWGHMRNSKHHWGGACDFDQKRRSVTAKFMYNVTSIAHRFGLTDGCTWHPKDCGHIEVPGPNSPHRNQYAMR